MKNLTLISTLAALSIGVGFVAPAAQAEDDCTFNGFYTTLSLGGAFRSGTGRWQNTNTAAFSDSGTSTAISRKFTFDIRQNSPFVALSLGQGMTFCDWYGGWEAYVSYSKYKRRSPIYSQAESFVTETRTFSNTIESKLNSTEVGFDLKPGFIFCCNTMLYGRLGVAYNKNTHRSSPVFALSDTGADNSSHISIFQENHRKRFAWRLGLGLERRFCNCLSLRADYALTYYGKASVAGSRSTREIVVESTNVSNMSDSGRVKLVGNVVTLGLSYWW